MNNIGKIESKETKETSKGAVYTSIIINDEKLYDFQNLSNSFKVGDLVNYEYSEQLKDGAKYRHLAKIAASTETILSNYGQKTNPAFFGMVMNQAVAAASQHINQNGTYLPVEDFGRLTERYFKVLWDIAIKLKEEKEV